MDNFVKELDELLSKYEITIYEAQKLYLDNHKKSRRLTQCYEDSNNIWCYYDGDEMAKKFEASGMIVGKPASF